jgi:hypothetical protein
LQQDNQPVLPFSNAILKTTVASSNQIHQRECSSNLLPINWSSLISIITLQKLLNSWATLTRIIETMYSCIRQIALVSWSNHNYFLRSVRSPHLSSINRELVILPLLLNKWPMMMVMALRSINRQMKVVAEVFQKVYSCFKTEQYYHHLHHQLQDLQFYLTLNQHS